MGVVSEILRMLYNKPSYTRGPRQSGKTLSNSIGV